MLGRISAVEAVPGADHFRQRSRRLGLSAASNRIAGMEYRQRRQAATTAFGRRGSEGRGPKRSGPESRDPRKTRLTAPLARMDRQACRTARLAPPLLRDGDPPIANCRPISHGLHDSGNAASRTRLRCLGRGGLVSLGLHGAAGECAIATECRGGC